MFHLQQLDTHEAFVRQLERHDGATLAAFAFHQPKDLVRLREDYLDSRARVPRSRAAIIARARAMMADHQRMRPVHPPPPEADGNGDHP